MSTNNASADASASQYNHAWEQVDADINWATITEDVDGNLISSTDDPNTTLSSTTLANRVRRRRRHLTLIDHAQSSRRIVRDMIRYLYLLLDLSANMYEKDPGLGQGANTTRLEVTLGLAQDFVVEYFDQNPLSQLGIVICKSGEAQVLSGLSGSRRAAIVALGAVREGMGRGALAREAGQFSLQNGLEVAGRSLGHSPRYGSREAVVLVGALSTCDPGDVLVDTLPRLKGANIRVSCLALSAEMQVCRKISEETGGIMGVTLDGRHLRDLLMNFTAPPPALPSNGTGGGGEPLEKTCEFVPMGFPKRVTETVPGLIHATSAMGKDKKLFFARTAYVCPRCLAKSSELPTDCAVCALKLVLAPHLARSFHHLFPVPPFDELGEEVEVCPNVGAGQKSVPVLPLSAPSSEGDPMKPVPVRSKALSTPMVLVSNSAFVIPPNLGFNTSDSDFRRVDDLINSSLLIDSTDSDRCCYVCLKIIGVRNRDEVLDIHKNNNNSNGGNGKKKNKKASTNVQYEIVPELLRFQCPECDNTFCADCDSYLHETLHNCPGCLRQ